ncbi:hypothetical protein [Chryseobacterium jejuense]|uniref:Uncharacterized protein n=1 Tax=Chryseobacterium jejuense TaxID=445960 RepID=A0A2X2Z021_CHRJE|nr:hypothetical protein [Chryseobacterium jejuense]SDJ65271.1 hypothetical protein SAMN05421542_4034 [Chryseobacterium jejuense]SQB43259.1 Uncharacterised protein [Chryseobacterium jejuense]
MKKNFIPKEKKHLPLIFKYVEVVKNKTRQTPAGTTIDCKKFQTDFYVKLKPNKFLVRIL